MEACQSDLNCAQAFDAQSRGQEILVIESNRMFWNQIEFDRVFAQPIVVEPYMMRQKPEEFGVLRLHHRSENSWAVIERPSGAIAVDSSEALLMKMTKREAETLAASMTFALSPPLRAGVFQPANRLML